MPGPVLIVQVSDALAGLRLLVVEDEALVAMLIEDALLDLGCEVVGPAGTVRAALRFAAAARGELDGALLDVNLGGEKVYPVADVLAKAGVPFLFVSGYGAAGLDAAHSGATVVKKPFAREDLARGIEQGILGRG